MTEHEHNGAACLAELPREELDHITETALTAIHEDAAAGMVAAVNQRFRVRTDLRSRNYGPNPMKNPLAGFCIHHTAGTETSDLPTLLGQTSRQVSSNDYINKQGVIFELVPYDRRAWAQGANTKNDAQYWNDGNTAYWSVEFENRGDGRDPYPQIQIDAGVWRLRQLRKRFPNLIHPDTLFRHLDYQAEKMDTSPNFPYPEFKRRVFATSDPTDGDNPLPVPEPSYKPAAKYTIIRPDTRWAKARAEFFADSFPGLTQIVVDADEAMKVSRFCNDNPKLGEYVCIVMGAKALPLVYPTARKNMLKYDRDECDTWSAVDDRRAFRSFFVLANNEGKSGLIDDYERKFMGGGEPKPTPKPEPAPKGIDLGPYRKDSIEVAHRYFGGRAAYGIPYQAEDGVMVARVADEVGMDLALAYAVVEQESFGRRVLGCDHGNVGDRPPYCNQEATRERVVRIMDGGKFGHGMNGIGLPQMTWWEFVLRAEKLGGAHIVRNQLLVCLGDLTQMLGNHTYEEALGRYNAGGGWRNVVGTYVSQVGTKHQAWKKRLA